jgi:hypothetical protein
MLYVVPDTRAAATNALRTALDARDDPFAAGATVGTRLLSEAGGRPAVPYVMVASDGVNPVAWPAYATDLLRLTAWAEAEDDAYDLAALCQALLAAHTGPVLRGQRPAGSIIRGRDRDTGVPMCSALVRAGVTPVPA